MTDEQQGEMSLLAIRITHSLIPDKEDLSGARFIAHHIKKTLAKWDPQKYIWSIESKDKFGKDTNPHIHFNVECIGLPSTDGIRKAFKRHFETVGIQLTGEANRKGRIFAISNPGEVEDEVRWWRYVIKQPSAPVFQHNMKAFVKEWRRTAIDEWERQVEANNKHVENYLDKNSFKGKMFDVFMKEAVRTEREFVCRYVRYCFEKSKSPSFTKIKDYWIEYQMKSGLITIDEWVDTHYFR